MSRDPRACPGRCNKNYVRAWDQYDDAFAAWQSRCAAIAILRAADNIPDDPEADARRSVRDPYRIPDPPAPPEITPTLGDPIWCGRDRSSLRAALTEIDRLAALLDSWADGHRGATSGEKVSSRAADAGTPSPIAATLDQLYSEVTDVEDEWREHRGYAQIRRGKGRGAHSRSLAIAFIIDYLNDILTSPDYTEFGRRVWKWEHLLQVQTKSDPVVRLRPGRCPRSTCGLVRCLVTRDDGLTECRGCGLLLNEDQYQREVVGTAGADVVRESREATTS